MEANEINSQAVMFIKRYGLGSAIDLKLISDLITKFDDLSTRELFTEVEKERITNLIDSYPDEVGVALLALKFKDVYGGDDL